MEKHHEIRSNTTRIVSEDVSRQHRKMPGNFRPHPIDFKVKSLDEILREKNLQSPISNLSSTSKDVKDKQFPAHNPSSTMEQKNSPSEDIHRNILLEKRLKRFGSNPQKSSNPLLNTQLSSTNSFSTTGSIAIPSSPSLLPAAMNTTSTTSFSSPLLDQHVDVPQLAAVAKDSERIFPNLPRPTQVAMDSTEKAPVKRAKIGDSKTGDPMPSCPNFSTTNRTSGNLTNDAFDEFEKDLNLDSCQVPLNYNEEDLDKQLAEMEHMLM